MGAAQGLRVAVPAGGTAVGNPVTQIASIVALAAAAQARAPAVAAAVLERWLRQRGGGEPAAHFCRTAPSCGPWRRWPASMRVAIVCGYVEQCSGRHHDAALFVDDRGCALANYRRTHFGAAEARQRWPRAIG